MNNDKRKSEYLNKVFKASKGEIEEILSVGFQPYGCWITLFKDDKIIQVPSYLLAQLKEFILEGETVKPHSTETNIRGELETLYNGCEKIFISAGDIIKDYLQSDYKRILESGNSLEKKIERMDSLIEKSTHLIGCYGQLSDAPGYNTGGLIFGSSVDEVLAVIDEPISRSLKNLQPMSNYSSNQSTLSLKKLTDIQKIALPKAKQYISLQISEGEKSTYGTHQDNSDWIKENWYKYRKQLPSDRQTDLKVQELYKNEFNGMTISTSHIQRLTDRQ